MITTVSLPQYENSVHSLTLTLNSPISGFEVSLMETGSGAGAFKTANLVTFSGKEGYLFDQSGHFFGGYESGKPFTITTHYDFVNSSFSYYWDGVLIANDLDVTGYAVLQTGNVNFVSFDKHGNSSLNVSSSGSVS